MSLEPAALRRAFAHYPTGVAVVTARGASGPLSLVVTSFVSVSLSPVLVAFCASRTSATWPLIAAASHCCVNVLAESQEALCKQLAAKSADRFAGVVHRPAASGAPILDGVVAWFDCRIVESRVAGDHDLVLLEVLAHDSTPELEPLVFHRSGYRNLPRP